LEFPPSSSQIYRLLHCLQIQSKTHLFFGASISGLQQFLSTRFWFDIIMLIFASWYFLCYVCMLCFVLNIYIYIYIYRMNYKWKHLQCTRWAADGKADQWDARTSKTKQNSSSTTTTTNATTLASDSSRIPRLTSSIRRRLPVLGSLLDRKGSSGDIDVVVQNQPSPVRVGSSVFVVYLWIIV